MKKILYFTLVVFAGLLTACSKSKNVIKPNDTSTTKPTTLDLIKDSVYLYTKETYLWYDALPDYKTFAPRSFTGSTDANALTSEVDKLSQYKINPATGLPYENYLPAPGEAKYSFIDDGSVSTQLGGSSGDFGFSVFFPSATSLYVKYVYPGSPADSAGLKRGYQITKLNGRTGLNADNDSDLQFVVNTIFGTSPFTMTVTKPDGTQLNVSIKVAEYTANPVLTYKIFTIGTKKVGYIVFNEFTVPDNASPQLLKAFNAFTDAKVSELVVDLRYNGGGSVATAQYLDNLIVPSANNGGQMFTYYYNDKLQADNHPLLSAIYDINKGDFLPANNRVTFSKVGSLNISRVFFIVTASTASASELTINNLLPHMDVKLIGRTSYGKPVGFFAIDINKYQLYVPQFETRNSANQGGYYLGMEPGSTTYPGYKDDDDVTKDFGDSTEVLLQHALNFIKTGNYSVSKPKVESLSSAQKLTDLQIQHQTLVLDSRKFRGMVGGKTLRAKR
ncbi:S41 family peptidase [Mucilaginibacter dorajii]|uniref:S41 family peptidase n=1 Tax=Mucilaginibacter dorajii TaxID=692994 RepID=A0ABP7P0E9_9SPHI|nr:S41 family peptidase [Mucilaginibacter dorajii]MCS3735584.1 C-terminal processing protease CtpA/Prc [Mucilaginibacter dorajii]